MPAPDETPKPPASFGNISEHHWSRARADSNREAIEYYRERSKAPGVAAGGASRNFYCMQCDGVIEHDFPGARCPHCQAELDPHVKRYFNWVEMNDAPQGDARAMLRIGGLIALVVAAAAALAWWIL